MKGKGVYKVIRWLVWVFYPKTEVIGQENLPEEPVLVVGNHAQMHGPIACQLYFPGKCRIWCAGQMMHLKEVPDYAYQDFWGQKKKGVRWFYRLLSYIVAPLSVCIFNNANTIGVYHDARAIATFKNTVKSLMQGESAIIFPECGMKYNRIVNDFQDKFVDVARLYYKKTGKELAFVPMYLAPALRKIYLCEPIRFCADNPIDAERQRICELLKERITEKALSLPKHKIVPYENMGRRNYPTNID
ncbi:MAG: hypothetical protein IJZ15_03430 [Oscillospiraceae bacterium]|nr:hypothetical protein [Oscillospiraceae bacterium]